MVEWKIASQLPLHTSPTSYLQCSYPSLRWQINLQCTWPACYSHDGWLRFLTFLPLHIAPIDRVQRGSNSWRCGLPRTCQWPPSDYLIWLRMFAETHEYWICEVGLGIMANNIGKMTMNFLFILAVMYVLGEQGLYSPKLWKKIKPTKVNVAQDSHESHRVANGCTNPFQEVWNLFDEFVILPWRWEDPALQNFRECGVFLLL